MTTAISVALALASAFSSPEPVQPVCEIDEEETLALDFEAFDQTDETGWRPLYRAGCYAKAADLLREWHDDAPPMILFHEAQMRGYAGQDEAALDLFARTYRSEGSMGSVAWNLYVDGNIAFLRRNRAGIEAAIAALSAIPKPPGWDQAVGVNGEPLAMPWPLNLNVLQAMHRCWEEPYEIAAHCHLPEWQKPDLGD